MSENLESHPVMRKYLIYYQKLKEYKLYNFQIVFSGIVSVITAPFHVISVSRQLSVNAHKEIYGDYKTPSDSKDLMKLSNELTLREQRNYQLIKSAGLPEGQKPYRAPIYDNYYQTLIGLYKQGILGFYKGNGWHLISFMTSYRFRILLDYFCVDKYENFSKFNFIRNFLVYTIADLFTHPCFVVENRYILQNRLPQFQIYPNFNKFRIRSASDMYQNAFGHIPKNFVYLSGCYIGALLPYLTSYNPYNAILFGMTASYPLMTGFRRMVCQSLSMPGLLPMRYLNLLHAVALIRREEGLFKGLYKGYTAQLISTFIWIQIVPPLAKITFTQQQTKEDQDLFDNDPIFEEVKNRKLINLLNK